MKYFQLPPGQVRFFALDPRTKLLALLAVNNFAYDFNARLVNILAACLVVFLMASRVKWSTLVGFVLTLPLGAISSHLLVAHFPGTGTGILAMLLLWTTHIMISVGIAVYVFTSTRVAEFTAALQALHVPRAIVVPFSVMLRFIPSVVTELRNITQAMKLRGIFPSPWIACLHPARTTEYIVVPLLASTTRMGDDLSASGLLRGLGRTGHRTCVTPIGFGLNDAVMLVLLAGICALQISGVDV